MLSELDSFFFLLFLNGFSKGFCPDYILLKVIKSIFNPLVYYGIKHFTKLNICSLTFTVLKKLPYILAVLCYFLNVTVFITFPNYLDTIHRVPFYKYTKLCKWCL